VLAQGRKVHHWENELLTICTVSDTSDLCLVNPSTIHSERWHDLAQPKFWQKIMRLSPDSCIINVGATREIIEVTSVKSWNSLSDSQKDAYRDSVRNSKGLSTDEKIFMTTGKNDFYQFNAVIPSITRGIEVFNENGVDPWYAQAILLIESPGKLAKSNVGAYGPFQLMKGVAIKQGLKVNSAIDERKDFDKSAWAAGKLIKNTCIPEAKRILSAHNVSFSENELWFRLFVLHIYHAGAGNVAQVINAIQPSEGGQQLITTMWQTKAGHFGNASQNYSQLALASFLVLQEMIETL
jgi:hypothetical protein